MSRTYRKNRQDKMKYKHKEEGTNIHHLQNVCNNGKTVEENLKEIKIRFHNSFHDLFGNKNTYEAMQTMFEFGKSQLAEGYIEEQLALWKKWNGKAIKNCCFKGKYSDNKGQKGGLEQYI